MARITVEDCVTIIPNRFELCLIASNRAKAILSGSQTNCDSNEKAAVISLREIADGSININEVKKNIVKNIKESSTSKNQNLESQNKEKILDAFAQESESETITQETSSNFISDNLEVED
ncbi:DNA-directed RNA polymerase subunit omega [Rickettsiales bacterium]|nr:DNA-directed RNA polymerase subunit omega [Rickettsiales bacterium]